MSVWIKVLNTIINIKWENFSGTLKKKKEPTLGLSIHISATQARAMLKTTGILDGSAKIVSADEHVTVQD